MPLSTTIILQFIAYLNMQGTPYSSIASVLSAISYKHKSADFPDPCKVFKVTQIMTSIKKSSIVKEKKLPITLPLLNKMIDSVQQLGLSDYETTLYKSMFLLQFYFGLRIGEITDSQHNISLSKISIQTDHIYPFLHLSTVQGMRIVNTQYIVLKKAPAQSRLLQNILP